MIVRFHKNFEKRFNQLRKNEQSKFKNRINIFLCDAFNPALNNHPLKGRYLGYRSINISGDLRAIYKCVAKEMIVFVNIDNHGNLYQ